jgi:hypothetical protein
MWHSAIHWNNPSDNFIDNLLKKSDGSWPKNLNIFMCLANFLGNSVNGLHINIFFSFTYGRYERNLVLNVYSFSSACMANWIAALPSVILCYHRSNS